MFFCCCWAPRVSCVLIQSAVADIVLQSLNGQLGILADLHAVAGYRQKRFPHIDKVRVCLGFRISFEDYSLTNIHHHIVPAYWVWCLFSVWHSDSVQGYLFDDMSHACNVTGRCDHLTLGLPVKNLKLGRQRLLVIRCGAYNLRYSWLLLRWQLQFLCEISRGFLSSFSKLQC